MESLGQYASDCNCKEVSEIRPNSPLENLKSQKRVLETRLTNVNAAIEALEKNPEVAKVLELLAKVR